MTKRDERYSVEFENQGQKIFGVVHRPLTDMPCPAVLMCHGFAGHKIGKNKLYVSLSEKLAELGIASLRFDFRGSGDSEGDFSHMTISGEVGDAVEATEYLIEASGIDSSALGIFGRSLGGIVAIMTAEQTNVFQSIAIWASAFHANKWRQIWLEGQKDLRSDGQSPKVYRFDNAVANNQFLEEFFSLDLEKNLKSLDNVPFLHIHGEKDEVVDISHITHFEESRKNSQKETKFIRLPETDHNFSHPEEQLIAIKETAEWFKRTLFKESHNE